MTDRNGIDPADLTLFAVPKPFTGDDAIRQRNAIGSWLRLDPRPEIILFGNDPGVAEVAAEFGVLHVASVTRNEFGTPLLDGIFAAAERHASHGPLCYVNSDIIFLDDFPAAISRLPANQRWLLSGNRWELSVDEPLTFEAGWQQRLRLAVQGSGTLSPPWAQDYFVYPRGILGDIPPFAVGRPLWDNWLVREALDRIGTVIDATPTIMAVHQRHGYAHVAAPGPASGAKLSSPELAANIRAAGGVERFASLEHATHRLTRDGLVARPPRGGLKLRKLHPASTRLGEPFNLQPEGLSALAITGKGVRYGDVIVFGGVPLFTLHSRDGVASALVPGDLLREVREVDVFLRGHGAVSNHLSFTIKAPGRIARGIERR